MRLGEKLRIGKGPLERSYWGSRRRSFRINWAGPLEISFWIRGRKGKEGPTWYRGMLQIRHYRMIVLGLTEIQDKYAIDPRHDRDTDSLNASRRHQQSQCEPETPTVSISKLEGCRQRSWSPEVDSQGNATIHAQPVTPTRTSGDPQPLATPISGKWYIPLAKYRDCWCLWNRDCWCLST